jgi:hypothetical protein
MTPRHDTTLAGDAACPRLVVSIGQRIDPAAARRLARLLFDSDTEPNRLAHSEPNGWASVSQGPRKAAGR